MVDIPAVFVTAGWLPALLLMCLLSLTAGAATHLLCDAIRLLPGNSHYERRVELLSAVQELLPRYIYKLAFAAFLIRRAGLSLSHHTAAPPMPLRPLTSSHQLHNVKHWCHRGVRQDGRQATA